MKMSNKKHLQPWHGKVCGKLLNFPRQLLYVVPVCIGLEVTVECSQLAILWCAVLEVNCNLDTSAQTICHVCDYTTDGNYSLAFPTLVQHGVHMRCYLVGFTQQKHLMSLSIPLTAGTVIAEKLHDKSCVAHS